MTRSAHRSAGAGGGGSRGDVFIWFRRRHRTINDGFYALSTQFDVLARVRAATGIAGQSSTQHINSGGTRLLRLYWFESFPSFHSFPLLRPSSFAFPVPSYLRLPRHFCLFFPLSPPICRSPNPTRRECFKQPSNAV